MEHTCSQCVLHGAKLKAKEAPEQVKGTQKTEAVPRKAHVPFPAPWLFVVSAARRSGIGASSSSAGLGQPEAQGLTAWLLSQFTKSQTGA